MIESNRQGGCPLRGMSAVIHKIQDFEAANLSVSELLDEAMGIETIKKMPFLL
ncbi:hypothetical protein HYW21_08325 [Candidatus Woesearchaeota archaeon]|nr:hypothetical protein [Candidatus Woesearchaeota archaeon]